MLHISWWFLLLVPGIYITYIIGTILLALLVGLIESTYLKLSKKKVDFTTYEPKASKLLNIFESKKIINIIIYFSGSLLLLIPINNVINFFRVEYNETQARIYQNKQFLNGKNYHYYKVTSLKSGSNSQECESWNVSSYYTFSIKTLEEIKDLSSIRINKHIYVKPFVIVEISEKEFLERTNNILLKRNY